MKIKQDMGYVVFLLEHSLLYLSVQKLQEFSWQVLLLALRSLLVQVPLASEAVVLVLEEPFLVLLAWVQPLVR